MILTFHLIAEIASVLSLILGLIEIWIRIQEIRRKRDEK